jgi:hypothetical protein
MCFLCVPINTVVRSVMIVYSSLFMDLLLYVIVIIYSVAYAASYVPFHSWHLLFMKLPSKNRIVEITFILIYDTTAHTRRIV